jgi:hypothetical protein
MPHFDRHSVSLQGFATRRRHRGIRQNENSRPTGLRANNVNPALSSIYKVEARIRKAPWITYLGPLYGESKSRFYASIDAFVFPTRYEHEADPRVVTQSA